MTESLQTPLADGAAAGTADHERAVDAAAAAAAVLPASTPLAAIGAQEGTEHVTAPFAGASVARVSTSDGVEHRIAVLVGSDLVNALAESPLGGLDLASATQPALDAAAEALGARSAPATTVDLALVVADMAGPFTAVPLVGAGIDAAVLLSDTLLSSPAAPVVVAEVTSSPDPAAAPPAAAPAQAPAGAPAATQAAEVVAPATPVAAAPPAPQAPPSPMPQAAPHVIPPFSAPVAAQGNGAQTLPPGRGIEMLAGVEMEVTVELGRTRMAVRDLLALSAGTVLELDRAADGPADLLVNGRLIARGEVVVVDEDFGLRITQIVDDAGV